MSARRPPIVGRYTAEEVALAARNRGMPLEALAYDVTPAGLHYLLSHFDIPQLDEQSWTLAVSGHVERARSFTLQEIKSLPARTLRVTLECAGNGRGQMAPRYPSVPWLEEGVSTAQWTGAPLHDVLAACKLRSQATEIVFHGADRGIDHSIEHNFARSLAVHEAMRHDVVLAYAMNGAALPPQHGAPLRLIVPRWYGMASVKWLRAIEAVDAPFEGFQQARGYHFRAREADKGVPCSRMRVNSLMVPPGIPDFYTRMRFLAAQEISLVGRAWSGEAPIARVQFAVDGDWRDATLAAQEAPCAWVAWRAQWPATPGEHELMCRASDAAGNVQPLEPVWDLSGFGNNAVQRLRVNVKS
jgi:sulfane dehydrogenase subunit SoxC